MPSAAWPAAHAAGASWPCRKQTSTGIGSPARRRPLLGLDRIDRVLERAVVELEDVQVAAALALEPAGQVHVDDVEPARPEAEVERLDVDDDLVALGALARPGPGRPTRASLAGDLDLERIGGDDGPAPELQHAIRGSSDDHAASIPVSASPETVSWGVWLAVVPLASRTQS